MSVTLSNKTVLLMAVSAGLAVANTYYSQPILKEIAASLAISLNTTGILPALSIAGYGAGLFMITPLGDAIDRKKLILGVQTVLACALLAMAAAPAWWLVCLLGVCIGMFGITAQLLIPMAATLNAANKARTVSVIVTGLLTGMLAARIFSGYITVLWGWRYVYLIAAVLVTGSTVLLKRALPNTATSYTAGYGQLLRSTVQLALQLPLLRVHALLGALIFGTFCSFWTILTLHLGGAPFYFQPGTIGLFSLVGIAGALATLLAGRYITPLTVSRMRIGAVGCIIAGCLLPALFPLSVIALVAAIVLLDVGVQATQLTNLAVIYTLHNTAHSRINTIYMTLSFIGGALGTVAGLYCWKLGGWPMVTSLLLVLAATALLVAWQLHARYAKLPLTGAVTV